jgi:XTP/dITP diphosphohydrolase
MEIIAATQNKHKIRELSDIMKAHGFQVLSLTEAGIPVIDIEEDGLTFEENSLKKARVIMNISGKASIADDSGLEVDCLNGAPGVYSARFAGVNGPEADKENNKKLLKLMEEVPDTQRTGRFVSVVTLLFPDGKTITARGECEGLIGKEERGAGGFGYDPLFTPIGYDKTFAELPQDVKNRISHRAKALAILKEKLE